MPLITKTPLLHIGELSGVKNIPILFSNPFTAERTTLMQNGLKRPRIWGTKVAKHPTLDFSSGHDLTVCGIKTCMGLQGDRVKPA